MCSYVQRSYRPFVLTDINECTEDTDDCGHECYNTVGSYLCDCPTGYKLDIEGLNCIGNNNNYYYFKYNNQLHYRYLDCVAPVPI